MSYEHKKKLIHALSAAEIGVVSGAHGAHPAPREIRRDFAILFVGGDYIECISMEAAEANFVSDSNVSYIDYIHRLVRKYHIKPRARLIVPRVEIAQLYASANAELSRGNDAGGYAFKIPELSPTAVISRSQGAFAVPPGLASAIAIVAYRNGITECVSDAFVETDEYWTWRSAIPLPMDRRIFVETEAIVALNRA